jgi:hypothetical protein
LSLQSLSSTPKQLHNSDSPRDDQIQFISEQSNTFGFSLSGSISCFVLHFQRVYLRTNYTELHRLGNEFCFSELSAKPSEFPPSMNFTEAEAEDADERGGTASPQEKANQRSQVIAMLRCCDFAG